MADSLEHQLKELLSGYPQLRLAFLFGSLAQGQATESSDIDIAVLADRPLDTTLKMDIISDLANRLGRPVDLIDLATTGEPLLGQVLQGKRLLGSSTLHGQLLSRHLVDKADFMPYRERILRERRQAWTK